MTPMPTPHSPRPARSDASVGRWMALAFCAQLVLSAGVLAALNTQANGTDAALMATGRVSFLLFWLAYAGSAMGALFGPVFQPLKRYGRAFGQAFAAAQLVHLGLVAWLCWIGAAPGRQTFIFFGVAVVCVYLLAFASVARLPQMLGAKPWWLLRTVALNYILYAFAVDFLNDPLGGGMRHVVAYLPFAALAVAAPVLRIAAFMLLAVKRLRARLSEHGGLRASDALRQYWL